MNKVFKGQRELPILALLNHLWHYTMDQRFRRYTAACQRLPKHKLTPYGHQQLRSSQQWAQANTIQISSPISAIVTQNNNKVYIVDLHFRTCTCGHFQENYIPCGHAYTFIEALQTSAAQSTRPSPTPRDYIPYYFTTLGWMRTYERNLKPISLATLPPTMSSGSCNAPLTRIRKSRGRLKTARMVPGSQRKKAKARARQNCTIPPSQGSASQACRYCGNPGHNQVTCAERKMEEARMWEKYRENSQDGDIENNEGSAEDEYSAKSEDSEESEYSDESEDSNENEDSDSEDSENSEEDSDAGFVCCLIYLFTH
ncbi:hypothetical protein BDZ91DRAFT_373700 [Kalaharituber pfeilii]|nr:hypothetical protein BDZ91DRAFT_373700 [Kalaharituber pfeilii]